MKLLVGPVLESSKSGIGFGRGPYDLSQVNTGVSPGSPNPRSGWQERVVVSTGCRCQIQKNALCRHCLDTRRKHVLWVIDMSSRRPSRWSGRRRTGAGRVIPLQRDAPSNELTITVTIKKYTFYES